MKKSVMILLAASLVAVSVPAMATQHGMKHQQGDAHCQDCELSSCDQGAQTIQQRIEKLQQAVRSNPGTYSSEEMSRLTYNLEDAQRTLAEIEQGGA